MHISVRYTPDLMEAIRLNLSRSRNSALAYAALGVLAIIAAQAWPGYVWLFYPVSAVLIIELPLLVLVGVYRNRQILRQEREFILTGDGVQLRTGSYSLRVAWEMVQRADELKNHWIIVTKKPTGRIALRKRALSQEQQTELAAFLQARQLNRQARKGMTPVAGG